MPHRPRPRCGMNEEDFDTLLPKQNEDEQRNKICREKIANLIARTHEAIKMYETNEEVK